MFSLKGGNGCLSRFFNSPQNFSTRECAHRNDTQKICIFSPLHKDLSSTYTVIMMRMLLSIRIRKITEMTLRKFVYLFKDLSSAYTVITRIDKFFVS